MKSKILNYPGESVSVAYDLKRCIHAAECVKGLPAVFNPDKKPWIDPAGASPDSIAEVIVKCPTGALKFDRHDGGEVEEPPSLNSVEIVKDGPLYARGTLSIQSSDGTVVLEDTRVALCRCGASKNKPLCDGSHSDAGFADPGAIQESKLKTVDSEDTSKLTIVLAKNGPLLLDGPVQILGTQNEEAVEGTKGALCRCGASSNKPFCDGTHKSIGFEA